MTVEEDVERLAELRHALTAIDVDPDSAERIRRRGRVDVVRGPSLRRFVLPAVATVVTASYLIWAVLKLIDVYR
jgi:hypothetical protein